MVFRVKHTTNYHYEEPVAEAYLELRLRPLDRENQTILQHRLEIDPSEKTSEYQDYFGNWVAFLSLPFQHSRLTIQSYLSVKTHPHDLPEESLSLTVQEVRQIQTAALPFVFHYLQPTDMVKIGREAGQWAKRYFRGAATLGEALESVTNAVHEGFGYRQGATEFSTDLSVVWRERIGVCQDFAHLMLSILRTAGMPARYVCGYIETHPPKGADDKRLIGSTATHAWVEIYVPGQHWVAIDPTNNCWCGPQYIAVSFGGDARDAAPIRGTFKGVGTQSMNVQVDVRRMGAADA